MIFQKVPFYKMFSYWWKTPIPEIMNYITFSYLDLKNFPCNPMITEDIAIWNQEYTENPYIYEFQIEVNYQDRTMHLRIIYKHDRMPLLHIHRWNLSKAILDDYSHLGQRYMTRENV